jgi:hypothetical protein
MTMIPIHFDFVPFTMVAFAFALLACAVGLFYSEYRENWPQHIGMFAVGIASALKIQQIYHRGYVTPETALLAAGVACFAAGVAWKVWQQQRNRFKPYAGPERRRDAPAHHEGDHNGPVGSH